MNPHKYLETIPNGTPNFMDFVVHAWTIMSTNIQLLCHWCTCAHKFEIHNLKYSKNCSFQKKKTTKFHAHQNKLFYSRMLKSDIHGITGYQNTYQVHANGRYIISPCTACIKAHLRCCHSMKTKVIHVHCWCWYLKTALVHV